jgi:sulfur-carrier protein
LPKVAADSPKEYAVPVITLKCYATLESYCPPEGEIPVPESTDLAGLLAILGIPPDEVKLRFVNGKQAKDDQVLVEGDRVGLFPPVGGG